MEKKSRVLTLTYPSENAQKVFIYQNLNPAEKSWL